MKTAKLMKDILNRHGFKAAEVDGNSTDRTEVLEDFSKGKYNVITNALLLTEGWDCPSVDCIIVLRPTKSKSLYCLDEQTEVLTKEGWKKDVEIGEEVLAFDHKTGKSVFKPVLAKIRRDLEEDEYFINVKGQSSDIRVTNKHRMIYDTKGRTGWKISIAEDVAKIKDGVYLPVTGQGDFKGVSLTNAELTFIGWVMTDGSINKLNNGITIFQSTHHKEYCDEITRCIEECGFKYTKHIVKRKGVEWKQNGDCAIWTISKGKPRGRDKDKTGWGRLEPWLSKDLSPALFDMNMHQFEVMLEAIHHGDGHKNEWISYHITKGNKIFIERLQMMAIQRGYRASVSVVKGSSANRKDLYTIHLKKQDFIKVGSKWDKHAQWVKEEHTDEKCWCVETELGTIFTRRNGKVCIMGNCQMVGRGTRTFPEGDKKDLLLLDFLWLTNKYELCHPPTVLGIDEKTDKAMRQKMKTGEEYDLLETEEVVEKEQVRMSMSDKVIQIIEENKYNKGEILDFSQIGALLSSKEIAEYRMTYRNERCPATEKQIEYVKSLTGNMMKTAGMTKGEASQIINVLKERKDKGLASLKQVKMLLSFGFMNADEWDGDNAGAMITMCASNGWQVPKTIDVKTFDFRNPLDLLGRNVLEKPKQEYLKQKERWKKKQGNNK